MAADWVSDPIAFVSPLIAVSTAATKAMEHVWKEFSEGKLLRALVKIWRPWLHAPRWWAVFIGSLVFPPKIDILVATCLIQRILIDRYEVWMLKISQCWWSIDDGSSVVALALGWKRASAWFRLLATTSPLENNATAILILKDHARALYERDIHMPIHMNHEYHVHWALWAVLLRKVNIGASPPAYLSQRGVCASCRRALQRVQWYSDHEWNLDCDGPDPIDYDRMAEVLDYLRAHDGAPPPDFKSWQDEVFTGQEVRALATTPLHLIWRLTNEVLR